MGGAITVLLQHPFVAWTKKILPLCVQRKPLEHSVRVTHLISCGKKRHCFALDKNVITS
jgi:hypothetical protein